MISELEKDFILHVTTMMINEFIIDIEQYNGENYFIIVSSIVSSVVATIGDGLSRKVSKNKIEMNNNLKTFFELIVKTAQKEMLTEDYLINTQEIH